MPASSTGIAADRFAIAFARIECHVTSWANKGFFEKRRPTPGRHRSHPLYPRRDRAGTLRHVLSDGLRLANCTGAWPEAEFFVIPDAQAIPRFEPGICRALVAACDKFAL